MAQELIIATADLAVRVNEYRLKATNLLEQAKRAEINDTASFANAQKFMGVVGSIKSNLEEERKTVIGPYDTRVRFINQQYKPVRDDLESAYELVRTKASAFERVERKRLMEEQERAQKAAEDEALRVAEEREKAGDLAGADAIVEMASNVTLPPAKVVIPRDELTGTKLKVRRVWEGSVEDVVATCAAIGRGDLPPTLIREFNKTELNNLAKKWAEERTDKKLLEIHRHGICAEEVDSVTR